MKKEVEAQSNFCLKKCGRCQSVCNRKKNHSGAHSCACDHEWECEVCGGAGENEWGVACSACGGNG